MKFPQYLIGLRAKTLFGLVVPISILFLLLTVLNENYLTRKITENYFQSVSVVLDASTGMLKHHTPDEIADEADMFLILAPGTNPVVDSSVIFAADDNRQLRALAANWQGAKEIEPKAIHEEALLHGGKVSSESNGYLEIAAPVLFKDGSEGVLAAMIKLAPRDELISSLRNRSIGVVGFGLLVLSGIIFLGLEHSFMGPLSRLRQATMAVEKGGFKPPSTITHQDELGDLTRSIHEMTDRIDGHAQALERRLSELTVLYNISKVASSSLDLNSTLETILESAVKVTEAINGFIMMDRAVDGEGAIELELRASLGVESGKAGEGIVSKEIADYVAVNGGPLLLLGDITRLGFRQHKEFRDAIYAPIVLGDKTIGVIGLVNKQSGSFGKKDLQLVLTLANQAAGVINAARLFADLQESYLTTIQALAAAIDAKDPYTRGHSSRVAGYSEMISEHLACSKEECNAIKIAAYLHDIGKIGIEEQILSKPTRLTATEFRAIQGHPGISAQILASVSFLKNTIPMVSGHHERFDGSGYPQGLAGKEIPLGARIIALADAFDAMTSDRPYRKALTTEEALAELKKHAGMQFDPEIVEVFVQHLEDFVFSDELVVPSW